MRAFSLAELLVSIAILTIISAAVLMVMNFGDRAFHMDSGAAAITAGGQACH
jgi:prepilin-type N-terminal cleavage/methylation domain-containing protein